MLLLWFSDCSFSLLYLEFYIWVGGWSRGEIISYTGPHSAAVSCSNGVRKTLRNLSFWEHPGVVAGCAVMGGGMDPSAKSPRAPHLATDYVLGAWDGESATFGAAVLGFLTPASDAE